MADETNDNANLSEDEVGEDGLTEAERRARAEGRKKHSRPILTITTEDGQTVNAEKVWGHCVFPSDVVRDFNQWCRDTGRKSSDVISDIIRAGLTPIFQEVEETKEERARARSVKKIANDEEALKKAEEKLAAKQAAITAQLEAIKARAAQIRASKDEGGVDPLSAILGNENAPEPVGAANGAGTRKKAKG